MVAAAIVYAQAAASQLKDDLKHLKYLSGVLKVIGWPPEGEGRLESKPLQNLIKAGALIAAEIDRLLAKEENK